MNTDNKMYAQSYRWTPIIPGESFNLDRGKIYELLNSHYETFLLVGQGLADDPGVRMAIAYRELQPTEPQTGDNKNVIPF